MDEGGHCFGKNLNNLLEFPTLYSNIIEELDYLNYTYIYRLMPVSYFVLIKEPR